MDYFNSCYLMKQMCDDVTEMLLERREVLEHGMVMVYPLFQRPFLLHRVIEPVTR